jgi:hypothetical protein
VQAGVDHKKTNSFVNDNCVLEVKFENTYVRGMILNDINGTKYLIIANFSNNDENVEVENTDVVIDIETNEKIYADSSDLHLFMKKNSVKIYKLSGE